MADNPVGVVRSTYEAFARGDIPAVLSMMDADVEWVESSAEGIPTRGVHRGPKQVAEHIFTVTDGKLAKLTNHHDTALWLQALGK